MGGAISVLATMPGGPLHNIAKVILLAPMCKMAEEMMLPPWVVGTSPRLSLCLSLCISVSSQYGVSDCCWPRDCIHVPHTAPGPRAQHRQALLQGPKGTT